MIFRHRARSLDHTNKAVAENLLHKVWGFGRSDKIETPKAAAYFHHFERFLNDRHLLNENADLRSSPQQSTDAAELISTLKTYVERPISEIHSELAINSPKWIGNPTDETTIDNVLRFAVQLWLFTKPDLNDKSMTLKQAVRVPLSRVTGTSNTWLWLDFSATMLERTAGFRWRWTSDITEHLTFASRHEVRIFAHSCVLERYNQKQVIENEMYPPGLLDEYLKSMNLLWPMEDDTIAKQVKRLEKENLIDIEAGMNHVNKFNLGTYQIFGERLSKIQERLEIEERRRGGLTVITVALWGIALTALFGLVSAATGIVSMWASLKQVQAI